MADPVIRLKRSAVAGKRPTLANVELGEVALNTYDGNLFTRQDTGGVGIGTTVTLLTPWQESYGAASISYSGDVNVTGVITASDGRLIAGVGISSEGTYIGSGVTAFNFVGGAVTSITVPSAGISTVRLDFNGLTGIFAKTENKFSATEGQTSFSVGYEVGYVDVFLNGVRLNSDNFTATDGSTVGLTTAASGGDAVDIIVYEPQASATPKRVVTNATATAGQTAFTVPSYDTGTNSMDVFLNGIKLDSAEFTETDGTTVTLAVGAALNDELQFISYESDNNFWSLNGSTLHRTSQSNPVAIGTNTSAGDYLTVGQPGAAGTSLFVHGGARITGILTIGTGSITLDGTTNKISGLSGGMTVGTGGSIFTLGTDKLALGTADKLRLYLDQNGNCGIGTNSPRNAAGFINLQIGDRGTGSNIDMNVGTTRIASMYATSSGFGMETATSTPISFGTAGVERMRLLSGGGLTFNGDTASANALDDYEEGTWTATQGGTWSTALVVGATSQRYVKIGRMVFLYLDVASGVKAGSAGYVTGIPYNRVSGPLAYVTVGTMSNGGVTQWVPYVSFIYSNNRIYFKDNDFTGGGIISFCYVYEAS